MGLGLGPEEARPRTALEAFRRRSAIDADTLDVRTCETYGPFPDCTSNQAIAWAELQNNRRPDLVARAAKEAIRLISCHVYCNVSYVNLAVECALVLLALDCVPHIRGYIHVQTNPKDAYSTRKTIDCAQRLHSLFKHLDPSFDSDRVCIKIPSTWEGLQACRTLQRAGVQTLATTVFGMEQAVLAAEAGCAYVAPYLHELRVHTEPGYTDGEPNIVLPLLIQTYNKQHNHRTKVLPAALTTLDEVFAVAGANHITLSPPLLRQCADLNFEDLVKMCQANQIKYQCTFVYSPDWVLEEAKRKFGPFIEDETAWRAAFESSDGGRAKARQEQALAIFGGFQDLMEGCLARAIEDAESGRSSTKTSTSASSTTDSAVWMSDVSMSPMVNGNGIEDYKTNGDQLVHNY